jgi:hypothetical protein
MILSPKSIEGASGFVKYYPAGHGVMGGHSALLLYKIVRGSRASRKPSPM